MTEYIDSTNSISHSIHCEPRGQSASHSQNAESITQNSEGKGEQPFSPAVELLIHQSQQCSPGSQGACWVGDVDVAATASDVLSAFCKTYHLKRELCTMHNQGRQLPSKQLLRKVRLLYQWLKIIKWDQGYPLFR